MEHVALTEEDIRATLARHLEHDFYDWQIHSITSLHFVGTFTYATLLYRTGTKTVCNRWGFRLDEYSDRVNMYFHDELFPNPVA